MSTPEQKVIFVTAGGAGMYCGSCMRDNTLVRNLIKQGWDVELVPAYTPITTDEEDVSVDRVFFGGLNMYLKQCVPGFRYLPDWATDWLDHPALIRSASSRQVKVNAKQLGKLTLATISGEAGVLSREHRKFVRWLRDEAKPDLVNLTNLLIGGCVPLIRKEMPGVPILVTLQGDDLFLDMLEEPWREQVITKMRDLAQQVDGFVTFSQFYVKHMSELLGIPEDRFHVVPLGIESEQFRGLERSSGRPRTIGYFARVSPEKGFHHFVSGAIEFAKMPGTEDVQFRAGGWLSKQDEDFHRAEMQRIEEAGLTSRFTFLKAPDRKGKLQFLQDIDVLSVPTEFLEPKGLYVFEAHASGLPVVQPLHGSFPDHVTHEENGFLVPPRDPKALAEAWQKALEHPWETDAFRVKVPSAEAMATATGELYRQMLSGKAETAELVS